MAIQANHAHIQTLDLALNKMYSFHCPLVLVNAFGKCHMLAAQAKVLGIHLWQLSFRHNTHLKKTRNKSKKLN